MGGSGRSRQEVYLEQRRISGFWRAFATQRSFDPAGEKKKSGSAYRGITAEAMILSVLVRRARPFWPALPLPLALLMGCAFSRGSAKMPPLPAQSLPAVKVTTRCEGGVTHFYVENKELCEVTMTFGLDLSNLKANVSLPYTATFSPGATIEAFTLTPAINGAEWEYSYTNYFKLGSNCARHDDSYVYQLPYAPGSKFKVTQGYNGSFSHKGSNQYAIDWQMPEGTPVNAARGGVVVKVKDDSSTGGSSLKYDPFNNYVLIRHDDGTLGHYCHLLKGGVCVQPGQRVQVGQQIALSGNTGFSSGAHLHFSVFKTKDGRERISIPTKFKTADGQVVTLVEGKRYKAAPIENATAPTIASGTKPRAVAAQ
jgi:murein DD-endopeptidase MepM/ murein hydrolase activator NlpD